MTMNALFADRYGSVDVLTLRDLEVPVPAPDEILVQVHAAAVNPADLHLLAGQPFFLRFMGAGLLRPRNRVPGSDVAGRVQAVGAGVRRFRVGDAVFANLSDHGAGGFAELVRAPERAWVKMPAGSTFAQAAATPMAAVTALQGLRDEGNVGAGQRILIHGASGGVGTFAVQIARALGADVTAVTSTRNLDLVRSLGAERVIDYTRDDFATQGERYDLVFDTVATRTVAEYRRVLMPGGRFVTTGFLPALALPARWRERPGEPRMRNFLSKASTDDLAAVAAMLEAGDVTPVIDRSYPLERAADALRYVAERRARGKVVIVP